MIMHKSTIRVGTTEGRFRMIMLSVMRQFKEIAFSGISPLAPECIEKEFLFDERLYLVVSEQMLKNYFPDRYPECVEEFKRVQILGSLVRCLSAGVCRICIACRY